MPACARLPASAGSPPACAVLLACAMGSGACSAWPACMTMHDASKDAHVLWACRCAILSHNAQPVRADGHWGAAQSCCRLATAAPSCCQDPNHVGRTMLLQAGPQRRLRRAGLAALGVVAGVTRGRGHRRAGRARVQEVRRRRARRGQLRVHRRLRERLAQAAHVPRVPARAPIGVSR